MLRGPVTDQAELHGLLAKIGYLGVPLLSVDPGPGGSVVDQQAVICDEARGMV